MGLRRKGREIALQTLYAMEYPSECEGEPMEACKEKLLEIAETREMETDEKIVEFSLEILRNTVANLEAIDAKIAEHSTNWSKDKIAMIDLCILRIAAYELLFTPTPPAIVMNEAIEIAKKYASESSGKFVNGILNSISVELK
ncbi:MAG TPA: transcription antitermination factor NusB [Candidatus Cloacimonadota bacterium]|nr:transcription antitermination factor NusB [Candidatus Cloacimonadota bacterium]